MMRRLLFVLALVVALPAAAAAEPLELRLSWWGGNEVHRAMLDSVRAFERSHPGIAVKTEYTGWVGHLERLTTQIAGGTAPDVMQVNWNWLVLFSRDGEGFYDLRRLDDVVDLDAFDPEALAMGTIDGRLNAIPVSMSARLFYFNATTFARAGLEVPSSWEELIAAGPVFRDRLGPQYYPLDLPPQELVAVLRARLVQRTGRPFIDERGRRVNATPDQLADLARFYTRLVEAHVIPDLPTRASYGHVAAQELRPWINGEFAGAYQWVSSVGKFIETLAPGQEVVLAPHPVQAGARDPGLIYRPSMMLAVNADTEHPREAAQLLDFLLNDPVAAAAMGLQRGVPTSAHAVRTLDEAGVLEGLAVEGGAEIATLPRHVTESAWFEHARVRDAFIDLVELYAYGRIDAETFGQRLHDDLNRILQRTIRGRRDAR